MEETPSHIDQPEISEPVPAASGVEIGNVVLGYEIPKAESKNAPQPVTKKEKDKDKGVLKVPHQKESVPPVKREKPGNTTSEAEVSPADASLEHISEIEFDRRHEVFTDNVKATRMAEGMVAIGQVLTDSSPQTARTAPLVPPPLYPTASMMPTPMSSKSAPSYKKYVTWGLMGGVLTGLALIVILAR